MKNEKFCSVYRRSNKFIRVIRLIPSFDGVSIISGIWCSRCDLLCTAPLYILLLLLWGPGRIPPFYLQPVTGSLALSASSFIVLLTAWTLMPTCPRSFANELNTEPLHSNSAEHLHLPATLSSASVARLEYHNCSHAKA